METSIRIAEEGDLATIVSLLADDSLGSSRESQSQAFVGEYEEAMGEIANDPNSDVYVVELNSQVVGCFQLTTTRYLTHRGGRRMTIEGVRIAADHRDHGIGSRMFNWIINYAKERHCLILQLTTDRKRPEALKFYEKIGFVNSHHGMKMVLAGRE